jgi:hypothetical protein|tara:strand:+ start:2542 stop:2676 length:135 start_codon:yes stop_codon:yes gene_type:complete
MIKWILIGAPIILIISWIWICYEIWKAPLLDDDDLKDLFEQGDL